MSQVEDFKKIVDELQSIIYEKEIVNELHECGSKIGKASKERVRGTRCKARTTNEMIKRVSDIFNIPVKDVPDNMTRILEQVTKFQEELRTRYEESFAYARLTERMCTTVDKLRKLTPEGIKKGKACRERIEKARQKKSA